MKVSPLLSLPVFPTKPEFSPRSSDSLGTRSTLDISPVYFPLKARIRDGLNIPCRALRVVIRDGTRGRQGLTPRSSDPPDFTANFKIDNETGPGKERNAYHAITGTLRGLRGWLCALR